MVCSCLQESVLIESKQLELHYEDVCRIFGELPHLKEVTKSGRSYLTVVIDGKKYEVQ